MKFRIWFLTLLVSEPSLLAQASVYVKKEQPDDHWSGLRLFMVILMAIGIIIYEVTNKKNRGPGTPAARTSGQEPLPAKRPGTAITTMTLTMVTTTSILTSTSTTDTLS